MKIQAPSDQLPPSENIQTMINSSSSENDRMPPNPSVRTSAPHNARVAALQSPDANTFKSSKQASSSLESPTSVDKVHRQPDDGRLFDAAPPASASAKSRLFDHTDVDFRRPRRVEKEELIQQYRHLKQLDPRDSSNPTSYHSDDDEDQDEDAATGYNSTGRREDNCDDEDSVIDDNGVIAIGIAIVAEENEEEVSPATQEPQPRSPIEATERLASFMIADDLAKQEHLKRNALVGGQVDIVRRESTRASMNHTNDHATGGPELAAAMFQDQNTSQSMTPKQREQMERQQAIGTMKTPPSVNYQNADGDAKLRARSSMVGAGVARAATTQSSAAARAHQRGQQEIQKMTTADDGPTLAAAVSSELSMYATCVTVNPSANTNMPGAFFSSAPHAGSEKQRDMDFGPSLAPAEFNHMVPQLTEPLVYQQSFGSSGSACEINVGAYAIEGMNANAQVNDLSDDEYSITDQNRHYNDAERGYDDIFYIDPDARVLEPPTALQAELQVVVEGAALTEEDQESLDPKAIKRLRMFQTLIFCCSFAAIALVIGAILGFTKSGPSLPTLGWTQAGATLYGSREEPQVYFGHAVDMNHNGTRIVVAAPGFDDDYTKTIVGEVRVFDELFGVNGTEWKQVGTITGSQASKAAETAISMSADGKRLAIGRSQVGNGVVEVYDQAGTEWSLSATLNMSLQDEEDSESWFGHGVDLSPDGRVLVVSAPFAENLAGSNSGLVRVYGNMGTDGWTQLGDDITGLAQSEFFGWSVKVKSDPHIRLVAGAPSSNSETGLARVFDWTGTAWVQVGLTIDGTNDLGRFGESVDLSHDGRVLAVGAAGTAFVSGSVRVFRFDRSDWVEDKSHDFVGIEPAEAYGAAVSLSADGRILAIGAGHANSENGRFEVYKFDKLMETWFNEGLAISGQLSENLGLAIALADDGRRILVGAPAATYDGSVAKAGAARVYDRDEDK
jgi:hypothetical protein